MASEQILFFGAIVVLLVFIGVLIWWRYLDKWRAPPTPMDPPHRMEMQKCSNCTVKYPKFFKCCPNCGKKTLSE